VNVHVDGFGHVGIIATDEHRAAEPQPKRPGFFYMDEQDAQDKPEAQGGRAGRLALVSSCPSCPSMLKIRVPCAESGGYS
jgi:hypothetical protein